MAAGSSARHPDRPDLDFGPNDEFKSLAIIGGALHFKRPSSHLPQVVFASAELLSVPCRNHGSCPRDNSLVAARTFFGIELTQSQFRQWRSIGDRRAFGSGS
jgi:hypothetical protein